jgi:hypothetical protein
VSKNKAAGQKCEDGTKRCPETSVLNQPTLRNNPEDGRIQVNRGESLRYRMYKVVQIWPGLIVCKQVTVCPGHIWTTLYYAVYIHVYGKKKQLCLLDLGF